MKYTDNLITFFFLYCNGLQLPFLYPNYIMPLHVICYSPSLEIVKIQRVESAKSEHLLQNKVVASEGFSVHLDMVHVFTDFYTC